MNQVIFYDDSGLEYFMLKKLRSPFWRHCVLSGETQHRALPGLHIEEIKI